MSEITSHYPQPMWLAVYEKVFSKPSAGSLPYMVSSQVGSANWAKTQQNIHSQCYPGWTKTVTVEKSQVPCETQTLTKQPGWKGWWMHSQECELSCWEPVSRLAGKGDCWVERWGPLSSCCHPAKGASAAAAPQSCPLGWQWYGWHLNACRGTKNSSTNSNYTAAKPSWSPTIHQHLCSKFMCELFQIIQYFQVWSVIERSMKIFFKANEESIN